MNCSGPSLDMDNSFFYTLEVIGKSYSPRHGVTCLAICVWGVLANCLHLVVLTSGTMSRSAVNALLAAIALCDMGLMADYLVYLLRYEWDVPLLGYWRGAMVALGLACKADAGATAGDVDNSMSQWWMRYLVFHACWSIALHTASLWISVAMAAFRYFTLRSASSMSRSRWHSVSSAWLCSLAIFAVTVALVAPTLMVHEVVEYGGGGGGGPAANASQLAVANDTCYGREPSYTVRPPQFSLDNGCRIYKLNLWLTGVLFKALPCLLLFAFFVKLVGQLRAADSRRRQLMRKQPPGRRRADADDGGDYEAALNGVAAAAADAYGKTLHVLGSKCVDALRRGRRRAVAAARPRSQAEKTNALLLVILLVFFITELPQGVLNVASAIYTNDVHNTLYQHVGNLLDLFSLVNSSLNFVIYASMSSKYRHTFCALFVPDKWLTRLSSQVTSKWSTATGGPPPPPPSSTPAYGGELRGAFAGRHRLFALVTISKATVRFRPHADAEQQQLAAGPGAKNNECGQSSHRPCAKPPSGRPALPHQRTLPEMAGVGGGSDAKCESLVRDCAGGSAHNVAVLSAANDAICVDEYYL